MASRRKLGIGGTSRALILALATILATFAVSVASPASAAQICSTGSAAGQCLSPEGVATDLETGRVYVADRGNQRVDVFAADGSFLFALGWGVDSGAAAAQKCTTASTCQQGLAGSGSGQFNRPTAVAVDNDPLSSSHHDVYVVDYENFRVEKFDEAGNFILAFGGGVNQTTSANVCTAASGNVCGAGTNGTASGQLSANVPLKTPISIAVGPGGTVYLTDTSGNEPNFTNRGKRFDSGGGFLEAKVLLEGGARARAIAVDSTGDVYFANTGAAGNALRKYDSTFNLVAIVNQTNTTTALAVDEADRLYAAPGVPRAAGGSERAITKYDSAGNVTRQFAYGQIATNEVFTAVLPEAFSGEVILSEPGAGVRTLAEPDPGPLPAPPNFSVKSVRNVSATPSVEINPEGKATQYRFEYVDQQSFEAGGLGFESPATKSTPLTSLAAGAANFNLQLAETTIGCAEPLSEAGHPGETEIEAGSCLEPETTYHLRVVATNADNPDGDGASTVVGPLFTTAKPIELLATYATAVGPDSARLNAEVNPLGIPATGYFEYVEDATWQQSEFDSATRVPSGQLDFGAGEGGVLRGVALSLEPQTTYHYRAVVTDPLIEPIVGPERTLRTFTPTGGGEASCPANAAFRVGPSALLADCRAYELVSPLDKEGGDIIANLELGLLLPSTLNQSSLDGDQLAYGSYRAFGDAPSAPFASQYVASRDPAGWSTHAILGPRTNLDAPAAGTSGTELKLLSPDLCQGWVRTVAEPSLASGAVADSPNIYRRQLCGGESWEALTTLAPTHDLATPESLELQGASSDGTAVIYVDPDNLPGTGAPDLNGEKLALYYRRAGGQTRYVCFLPNGNAIATACTAGTAVLGGGEGRVNSVQGALSADGNRVFWTAFNSSLGTGAPATGQIYVRERPGEAQSAVSAGVCVQPARACTLPVSAEGEVRSGTSSSSFWGASRDGSKAVFSSGEDLYEYDVDTRATELIAHQSAGMMGMSEDGSLIYLSSRLALAPANPQGRSPQPGQPNLYLYDAEAATERFHFVATLKSADLQQPAAAISLQPRFRSSRVSPDGLHATFMSVASPTDYDNTDAVSGQADAEVYLYDATAGGKLTCVSCNPSGSRPDGEEVQVGTLKIWAGALTPIWSNIFSAPRALSEDGNRVYFESPDSLTPVDSNGALDVYQWEAATPGGGCATSDPDYSAQNEGCVSLISSGQSAAASHFLDASPDGADVFFATLSSLVSQDYGLVDIYDARVAGGFPAPAGPPTLCEGEACQPPPAVPNDPTPASALFQGPGNVVEKPAGKQKKKQHRKKAAKKHRKKHGKKANRDRIHHHHKRRNAR